MARKGKLRRQRKALEEREREEQLELGTLVLKMYREDHLDRDVLSQGAAALAGTGAELEGIRRELGESAPAQPDTAEASLPPPPATAETSVPPPSPAPKAADDEFLSESGDGADPELEQAEDEPEPSDPLSVLTREIEETEARMQAVATAAREEAERKATEEIHALEQDIEREQQRAAAAVDELRARLRSAEELAERAERERERNESEARSAAAAWLRGQAAAMRREAERQVRGDLESLQKDKRDAEAALAEMTKRSNDANARAEKEREAKERAVARAEERLAEIEEYVRKIEGRLESGPAKPQAAGREEEV